MANLTVYWNEYNVENIQKILIDYIIYPKVYEKNIVIGCSKAFYYGGHNIFYYPIATGDTASVAMQMSDVIQYFGKEYGQCLIHFSLNFASNGEDFDITAEDANRIGDFICKKFFYQFQIVYAVHQNRESHLHIHFVLNGVNLQTGKKPRRDFSIFYELRNFINNCRGLNFRISSIKSHKYNG